MSDAALDTPTALSRLIVGNDITSRDWPVHDAFAFCEQVARAHYENFPVGSLLIPKRLRKHFYSIYAFARIADDFADEEYDKGISQKMRLDLLARWREMLKEASSGRASHPVFIALAETITIFNLPVSLFEDLLSAFMQDAVVSRYQSYDLLIDYCRRSANPIGRLILLLFGYRDERLNRWSDSICTALQLANHWQDVAVDLGKDRIYLPAEDLARFNVSEENLKRGIADEGFRRLMKFEVERARELLAQGKPLCLEVGGRLGLELRAIWLAGSRILDRIEDNNYDTLHLRPVITASDKARILFGALSKRRFRAS